MYVYKNAPYYNGTPLIRALIKIICRVHCKGYMYICTFSVLMIGQWSVQSQVTNTSSQDSIQDGLSPDMSDYDHSSELDNDPREIHIPKTSSNFGERNTTYPAQISVLI